MKNLDYFGLLRRNGLALVLVALLGAAAGLVAAQTTTKEYDAQSRVFVSAQTGASAADLYQSGSFTQDRVKSYADVVTSRAVLVPVAAQLGLAGGANDLEERVSATVPLDTVIVRISVRDSDARRAALAANAIAQQFKRVVSSLEVPKADGSASVRVSIVEGAQPATEPATPNTRVNVLAGALLGLMFGWFAMVARAVLDTRIKSGAEVADLTGFSTVAEIRHAKRGAADKTRVLAGKPNPYHAEAYRQLRTNLQFANVDAPPRVIVVTSSVPAEGKTTVASNLAATLAETGAKVVLVDADLRRPATARSLELNDAIGLTSVLTGKVELAAALQPVAKTSLRLLAAGGTPPNPSEILASESMRNLVAELATEFDYVLIDTPPLLPVTDGAVLASRADGVLFVVRRGVVRRPQIERATAILRGVDASVLGIVINGVRSTEVDAYGYSGVYEQAAGTAHS